MGGIPERGSEGRRVEVDAVDGAGAEAERAFASAIVPSAR